jgi:DNA-binding MarR family transcriptional regulator
MIALSEIRRYRRSLRRFERVSEALVASCCAQVTLAQCIVLMEIDEGGELSMSQLAASLRLDNSTLSRTIESLVGKGLVERLRDDGDRRVVLIRLTQEGKSVCRAIHQENDEHCRCVLGRIPASKRAAVIRCFEVLVQAYLDQEAESMVEVRSGSTASSGAKENR